MFSKNRYFPKSSLPSLLRMKVKGHHHHHWWQCLWWQWHWRWHWQWWRFSPLVLSSRWLARHQRWPLKSGIWHKGKRVVIIKIQLDHSIMRMMTTMMMIISRNIKDAIVHQIKLKYHFIISLHTGQCQGNVGFCTREINPKLSRSKINLTQFRFLTSPSTLAFGYPWVRSTLQQKPRQNKAETYHIIKDHLKIISLHGLDHTLDLKSSSRSKLISQNWGYWCIIMHNA